MDGLQKNHIVNSFFMTFENCHRAAQAAQQVPGFFALFIFFHFLAVFTRMRGTERLPQIQDADTMIITAAGHLGLTDQLKLVFFGITECLSRHCGAVELKLSFFRVNIVATSVAFSVYVLSTASSSPYHMFHNLCPPELF